jgi:hypothetical protein
MRGIKIRVFNSENRPGEILNFHMKDCVIEIPFIPFIRLPQTESRNILQFKLKFCNHWSFSNMNIHAVLCTKPPAVDFIRMTETGIKYFPAAVR